MLVDDVSKAKDTILEGEDGQRGRVDLSLSEALPTLAVLPPLHCGVLTEALCSGGSSVIRRGMREMPQSNMDYRD